MAFKRKLMSVKFELGQSPSGGVPQTFNESGSNTVTLTGLRMAATIKKAGTPSGATLNMQIWGMRLELMNKLATLGMVYAQIRRNTITVSAYEEGDAPAVAFTGTILQAWTDFTSMPEVPFHIEAQTLGLESVTAADPVSIKGSADVVQLMQSYAKQMGLGFESNGLSGIRISNPYFYGAPAVQAAAVARAAGINWYVDNGVLAIWQRGKSRGGTVPLISPTTGLVGYPGFTAYGITLKTVFNPDLRFGASIKLESSLKPANIEGNWTIYSLDHDIATQMPQGRWYTDLTCYNPNFPAQVQAK